MTCLSEYNSLNGNSILVKMGFGEGSNVGSNLYDPTNSVFCQNKPVLGIPDEPELVRKSYS